MADNHGTIAPPSQAEQLRLYMEFSRLCDTQLTDGWKHWTGASQRQDLGGLLEAYSMVAQIVQRITQFERANPWLDSTQRKALRGKRDTKIEKLYLYPWRQKLEQHGLVVPVPVAPTPPPSIAFSMPAPTPPPSNGAIPLPAPSPDHDIGLPAPSLEDTGARRDLLEQARQEFLRAVLNVRSPRTNALLVSEAGLAGIVTQLAGSTPDAWHLAAKLLPAFLEFHSIRNAEDTCDPEGQKVYAGLLLSALRKRQFTRAYERPLTNIVILASPIHWANAFLKLYVLVEQNDLDPRAIHVADVQKDGTIIYELRPETRG